MAEVKRQRIERMRQALPNALAEQPVPPLADLSRRLGYPHTAVLWRNHSDLCHQIMARRRVLVAKRTADLERIATAVLQWVSLPSLRGVCRRLDINVRYMNVHFPALARRIVEEHHRCIAFPALLQNFMVAVCTLQ